MPDTILLEGIQVPAALGVTAAERRRRRPVRLDLEVEADVLKSKVVEEGRTRAPS